MKRPKLASFLNIAAGNKRASECPSRRIIGVLPGVGIGPDVITGALEILRAVEQTAGIRVEVEMGGPIGEQGEAECGQPLPDATAASCRKIFQSGGAILSGPGGGRYVYDLRRRFDLFCKFVPVNPWPELAGAGRISRDHAADVDLLIVRDNIGGVYQGRWRQRSGAAGRVAGHSFSYSEKQVRRLVEVAARAAASRRGRLHVILKDGGIPAISGLWRDVGETVARDHNIEAVFMNVDLAAYQLIQHPETFDVLVAPNLFGDVLADLAGVLVGSRGLTFSGNYDGRGHGVYQTNHGCAHDLAGRDIANPAGQILSLAMLLRESLDCDDAADAMEAALAEVWAQGWRTADITEPGCRVVGTRAMIERIVAQVFRSAEKRTMARVAAVIGRPAEKRAFA